MPLFWAGLLVLLFLDLAHLSLQYLLYSCGPSMDWAYSTVRTKFRISFGRSFSEAALSSISIAAICCILHARNISITGGNFDDIRWKEGRDW